jgi:hypothetical protein
MNAFHRLHKSVDVKQDRVRTHKQKGERDVTGPFKRTDRDASDGRRLSGSQQARRGCHNWHAALHYMYKNKWATLVPRPFCDLLCIPPVVATKYSILHNGILCRSLRS